MAATLNNISLNDILSDEAFICEMHLGNISADAFKGISTLTAIEIYSAENIATNTLSGCNNLKRLVLPGIENYSTNIFGSKLSLDYLEIRDGTKNIGTILTNITSDNYLELHLPASLTALNANALSNVPCQEMTFSNDTALCANSLNGSLINKLAFDPSKASTNLNIGSATNLNEVYCLQPNNAYTLNTQLSGCTAYDVVFQNQGTNISSISPSAFLNCSIGYIDLSRSSFTELNTDVFKGCTQLQQVYLNNNVTAYYNNCFNGCNALRNFKLDVSPASKIEYLGYNASLCSIPNTLTSIGNQAFMNANVANKDVILTNLTSLALSAFILTNSSYSSNIESITFNADNIEQIPNYCFYNQAQIISYNGLNKVNTIGDYTFYNNASLTSINISNVKTIRNHAFENNGLQTIDLPQLTSIGDYAFYNNTSLTSINISNVKTIGAYAFANCASLKQDHINEPSPFVFEVPSTLTSIGNYAFDSCNFYSLKFNSNIITANIANSTTIFNNCANVGNIDAKSISYRDFATAYNLTSNPSIEEVYDNRINKDIISKACQNICDKLFGTSTTNALANTFYIQFSDITITKNGEGNDYVCLQYQNPTTKNELININTVATDYQTFISNPILNSNTKSISANALNSALNHASYPLTSLNLNQVNQVADGILSGSNNFISAIANSLTLISKEMFANDSDLTCIIAKNVTNVDEKAFYDCSKLQSIDLTSLTTIQQSAFYGCDKIANLDFCKNNLQTIHSYAFANCDGLTSINNLNNLQTIHSYAFANCTHLREINLVNSISLTTCVANAFNGIQNLTYIEFPSSLANINSNSLCCSSTQLTIKFNALDDNVLPFLILDNSCGSPIETMFKTQSGKYPRFITKNANEIIQIENAAFNVNSQCKLQSIDSNVTQITESEISNLNGILSTAFNGSYLNNISLPTSWLTSPNAIANSTFSSSNCPHLNTIHFNMNAPELTDILSFYRDKTSSNSNIRITFNNAWFNGTSIVYDNDPFIFRYANNVYTIIGVNDSIIMNDPNLSNGIINTIGSLYTQIDSYAFQSSKSIKEINNFNNISCLCANAFTFNTSISSINIGNSSTKIFIDDTSFTDSSLQEIHFQDNISGIENTGIKGYGLNDCLQLRNVNYDGNITSIAPSAMINTTSILSSIMLPSAIEEIQEYAFAETYDRFPRIKNINLYDLNNLTSIGKYAFYNAIQSLPNNELIFPKNLRRIEDAAFAYRWESYIDELSNLNIEPDPLEHANLRNVNYIGLSAFAFNKFKNIKFNKQIQYISSYAFAYSKYKYDIHIPSSIKKIGENAFYKNVILNPENIAKNIVSIDCHISAISDIFDITINSNYEAENKVGFTDATVISATFSPNNGFAYIYNNIMQFCPDNLSISLIDKALAKCDPASITAYVQPYIDIISSQTFYGCTELSSLSVHQNVLCNDILSIGTSAFYDCSSLINIKNIETNEELFQLSNVNDYAFYNCQSLSNITLLSTVEYVGDYAFTNCKSITAFHENNLLSDVQYWKLSSIGDYAFASCDSLTSFNIPSTISAFGQHMFDDCTNLSNVNINIDSSTFLTLTKNTDIGHAVSSLFNDINDEGTCYINFLDIIYMNNGIVKIDNEYVNIYDNSAKTYISSLNYQQFIDENKTYLNLLNITGIDQFVFSGLTQLASISFLSGEQTIDDIGAYAFNGCNGLISFNNGKFYGSTIGMYAFSNCHSLIKMAFDYTKITSSGNQQIHQGVFYGTSLNNLIIDNCPVSPELDPSSGVNIDVILNNVKIAIGYDISLNPNPLELPEYCIITFYDSLGNMRGKYDYLFNNLLGSTIDINRNALIFADKAVDSIRPLLIVKANEHYLPSIITNTFHANIVGRWK